MANDGLPAVLDGNRNCVGWSGARLPDAVIPRVPFPQRKLPELGGQAISDHRWSASQRNVGVGLHWLSRQFDGGRSIHRIADAARAGDTRLRIW